MQSKGKPPPLPWRSPLPAWAKDTGLEVSSARSASCCLPHA